MEKILSKLCLIHDSLTIVDEYLNQSDNSNYYTSLLSLANDNLDESINQLELLLDSE